MNDTAQTTDGISPSEFLASEGVEDWRVIGDGVCAFFAARSLAIAARFVEAIGALPRVDANVPDLDIRPDGVTVRLVTYTDDWFGPSRRDVVLAGRISAIARDLGLAADPSRVQSMTIVIDALDIPGVMPFWAALLGYEFRRDNPSEDVVDPQWRLPGIWFEQMDEPRPQRNRIHFAVWVPYEEAEARVAAAIAAGGRLVTDRFAPMWWVLADAEGNEADVATINQRD